MRYLPHTREDIDQMLQAVGATDLDALFNSIPGDCRRKEAMNLPDPLTEWELNGHMDCMAASMCTPPFYKVFMGAGSYSHYIPEITRQLLLRSEIFTAYTPYQPEISQGTLQTIYEYQTLVCRLLGMDVANASMYDGASGLAEALLMTIRASRRKRVAVLSAVFFGLLAGLLLVVLLRALISPLYLILTILLLSVTSMALGRAGGGGRDQCGRDEGRRGTARGGG